MKESKTAYAYLIDHMQDPSFLKVWNVAYDFVHKLPSELCTELHESLNRGVDVLDSEPLLEMYIYAFGKMHNAKLQHAFQHLHDSVVKNGNVELIDYGCGQGLASICYHDFIKEHNPNQKVTKITLIEPSALALSRAELLCAHFYPNTEIVAVNKSFDKLNTNDILVSKDKTTIHLFSNIIDIESYDLNHLIQIVKDLTSKDDEYVIVSPIQNSSKTLRLKDFASRLGVHIYYENYLNKRQLDETRDWTCAVLLCTSVSEQSMIVSNADKVFKEACLFREEEIDPNSEECKKLLCKLRICAESGDKRCQNQLGLWYEYGIGTEQNISLALKWYEESAKQEYASAYANLGNLYIYGKGVERDFNKAFNYFQLGLNSDKNHSGCLYYSGVCYLTGKGTAVNREKAVSLFTKASTQGNARAKLMLYYCLINGCGTNKDESKAIKYLRDAVKQRHPKACYVLGTLYESGKQINADEEKAFKLYKKSAVLGYEPAQEKLGEIYREGILGKTESPKKSFNWYYKAAEQGNASAQFYIGYYYDEGYGVKKDENLSFKWYSLAAEQNNPAALNNLAICYEYGEGTKINLEKAAILYEESAKLGSIRAQKNIANCYKNGIGVKADECKAMNWTLEAAKRGDVESLGKVAKYYFIGYGTDNSLEKAFIWYAKYYFKTNKINNVHDAFLLFKDKAASDDAQSLYIVGKCLQYGIATEKNIKNANVYFRNASKLQHIEALIKVHDFISITKLCSQKNNKETIEEGCIKYSKDKRILISCNYLEKDEIRIPSSVRIICDNAFRNSCIGKIIIPSSVIAIGKNPFLEYRWGQNYLKSIECLSPYFKVVNNALYTHDMKKLISYFGKSTHFSIADGVEIIGSNAFEENQDLRNIIFPYSLRSVESSAFRYCSKLESISLPINVNEIGEECFYGCESLSEVQSLGRVEFIPKYTFMGCNIKRISLPESLIEIDDEAFNSNKIESLAFPKKLKRIGNSSFAYCNIKNITLNGNLQEIGDFCFFECPIENVSIPSSLNKIGINPFIGTKKIESKNNSKFISGDGLLYNKEDGGLISHYKESEVALYPPINHVNSFAFCNSKVTFVFMGNNIVGISPWAFYKAKELRVVIWKNSRITEIPNGSFRGCSHLQKIRIPSSVEKIQDGAFYDCLDLSTMQFDGINTLANEDIFRRVNDSFKIPDYYRSHNGLMGSTIDELTEKKVDISTFPEIEIIVPKGCHKNYNFSTIFEDGIYDSREYYGYDMNRTFIIKEDDN